MVSAQWSALKGASLPQHEMLADVRFGSKADICGATRDVRFALEADMVWLLFDHLIRNGDYPRRHLNAEQPRRLKV